MQNVAYLLQSCLAHSQGVVCQSVQSYADGLINGDGPALFTDHGTDSTCMSNMVCKACLGLAQEVVDLAVFSKVNLAHGSQLL